MAFSRMPAFSYPPALPKNIFGKRQAEKEQDIAMVPPLSQNPIFDILLKTTSKRLSDGSIGGSQKFGQKLKN